MTREGLSAFVMQRLANAPLERGQFVFMGVDLADMSGQQLTFVLREIGVAWREKRDFFPYSSGEMADVARSWEGEADRRRAATFAARMSAMLSTIARWTDDHDGYEPGDLIGSPRQAAEIDDGTPAQIRVRTDGRYPFPLYLIDGAGRALPGQRAVTLHQSDEDAPSVTVNFELGPECFMIGDPPPEAGEGSTQEIGGRKP